MPDARFRGSGRSPGPFGGGAFQRVTADLLDPGVLPDPGDREMVSKKSDAPWVVTVPVVVADRKAAKRWYTKSLGLTLSADDDHWVVVGGKERGSGLHLCQASENQPKPIAMEPGPSGIVIAIPGDFEKECARLRQQGVEFSHLPEKAPWGWYATVRDPDGNEHHLMPSP
jgi:catechol 2,3-dioxygenase-like lactoylglutathione lyase family enzyme